ncbi:MAG: hypothetical protein OXL37_11925 [Chloroflexota bacterium]|nr:hypothetical protein [Chloroflexota bacterium]MDE2962149.1 hypothetical protein [Chloroflexota bacterium]
MTTYRGDAGQSRTMKASESKAKCLRLMDEVAENGGEKVGDHDVAPPCAIIAGRIS